MSFEEPQDAAARLNAKEPENDPLESIEVTNKELPDGRMFTGTLADYNEERAAIEEANK